MKIYKLGQIVQDENPNGQQKVVAPLPPAAPPQPQTPQAKTGPQISAVDKQVAQFINQNRNTLSPEVRNALANPQQRGILVSLIESISDPANIQFMQKFVAFTKQLQGQMRTNNVQG